MEPTVFMYLTMLFHYFKYITHFKNLFMSLGILLDISYAVNVLIIS